MPASMTEMVEAHLLNVQRELETLKTRVSDANAEQARLQAYLEEGKATLQVAQENEAHQAQARATVMTPEAPLSKPF